MPCRLCTCNSNVALQQQKLSLLSSSLASQAIADAAFEQEDPVMYQHKTTAYTLSI